MNDPDFLNLLLLSFLKFLAWYEFAKYKKQKMVEVAWFFIILSFMTALCFIVLVVIERQSDKIIKQLQEGVEIRKKETTIRVYPNTI